jgi:hypothetical protein
MGDEDRWQCSSADYAKAGAELKVLGGDPLNVDEKRGEIIRIVERLERPYCREVMRRMVSFRDASGARLIDVMLFKECPNGTYLDLSRLNSDSIDTIYDMVKRIDAVLRWGM